MGADELSRWRDALLVDKDDVLIGAARRWLGPVRTPFNKHELVERLEAFLRRPATLEAMIGLLDRADRRILAFCIYGDAGGGLPTRLLARLAADDAAFEPAALDRIRNLRERLVLYALPPHREGERVALAPPLRERLADEIEPADALSTALPAAAPSAPDPFMGFCALMSACAQAKPAYKTRRDLSKRASELLQATAPTLATDRERLATFAGGLRAAGAFGEAEDGRPEPYPRRFADFCREAGPSAPLALAAACVSRLLATERGAAQEDLALLTESLAASLAALPNGLAFSPRDLERIVALALLRKEGATPGEGARASLDAVLARAQAIAGALSRLGYVVLGDDGLVRASASVPSALAAWDAEGAARVPARQLVVEDSHELRLLPEAAASARAFVSSIARLEQTGLAWSAALDRAAAKAAFAHGFRAGELGRELERLSLEPLPQSLRFSLEAWEAEADSARIRAGVVVALDGHLAGALEHAPGAAELVAERLGEGVYLLAAKDVAEAERLLKAAGIEVDSRPRPRGGPADPALLARLALTRRERKAGGPLAFGPPRVTLDGGEPRLVSRLLAALGRLDLSPVEREAAEQRVRARLVLEEGELAAPPAPREEAGRLDYPGKLRLLERALKDGAEVSVDYDDGSGAVARAVGIPRRIGRSARGMIVTLSVRDTGQEEIAIAAISLAARL